MSAPLLLFGGSFDPPHRQHAVIAQRAKEALGADEILVIPARLNPQRAGDPPAPAADRMELARRAFASLPRCSVSDLEIRRDGPSFTIDTLRELRRTGERRPLRLLIGSDQALNFHSWREAPRILELAQPVVVLRPPHTRESFERDVGADPRWMAWLLPIEPIDHSSTDARRRLAAGESIDGLLSPEVESYIREHGLYGARR